MRTFIKNKQIHGLFLKKISPIFLYCSLIQPMSSLAATYVDVSDARVSQIATWLKATPAGYGPTCSDRISWSLPSVQNKLDSTAIIAQADQIRNTPFPAWDQALYDRYKQDGNREVGNDMMMSRFERLKPLVLAECLTWSGAYLPEIEKTLKELNTQVTWIHPAHTSSKVELLSSAIGANIAHTLHLLGAKLSLQTITDSKTQLNNRILKPTDEDLKSNGGDWWRTSKMNWNPVVHFNIAVASLSTDSNKTRRAAVIATSELQMSTAYPQSISSDGYCSEGSMYWRYGFLTHFIPARELIYTVTQKKIDLFNPVFSFNNDVKALNIYTNKMRASITYPLSISMGKKSVPSFGDSVAVIELNPYLFDYATQSLGVRTDIIPSGSSKKLSLVSTSIELFAIPTVTQPLVNQPVINITSSQPYTFFDNVGVMISRAGNTSIAIKGGGNTGADGSVGANFKHSHNDIGSYIMNIDDTNVLGDFGSPVYSSKTFNPATRYQIRSINSWGHPVPVIMGNLQLNADTLPYFPVYSTSIPYKDSFSIDLTKAYPTSNVVKVMRSLVHDSLTIKDSKPSIVSVRDDFEYKLEGSFETAMVTRGTATIIDNNTVQFYRSKKIILAKITASAPFNLIRDDITEEGITFTRFGIVLSTPAKRGWVEIKYEMLPETTIKR